MKTYWRNIEQAASAEVKSAEKMMSDSQAFIAEGLVPIGRYRQALEDLARRADACGISGHEEEGDIVLPPLYDSEAHVEFLDSIARQPEQYHAFLLLQKVCLLEDTLAYLQRFGDLNADTTIQGLIRILRGPAVDIAPIKPEA
ncbi:MULTISPECIES: hypothetical protein [Pseudophaeobacter]|uniref:hypothetical protein n=1 Tax=Pseudophaeobacter TaxID=1541822 RepID=UPI00242C15FE|nr:hypothetical protein [Pseudophaeobacter profundi]